MSTHQARPDRKREADRSGLTTGAISNNFYYRYGYFAGPPGHAPAAAGLRGGRRKPRASHRRVGPPPGAPAAAADLPGNGLPQPAAPGVGRPASRLDPGALRPVRPRPQPPYPLR